MGKGYDERPDLYFKHITNHSHRKASPYIQPLGRKRLDKFQKFMLCAFHDTIDPTVTPLAPHQTALQENHVRNAPNNLQLRHQLPHLKSQNLKLNSFQVF